MAENDRCVRREVGMELHLSISSGQCPLFCDRCGSTSWFLPKDNPERYPKVLGLWGHDIMVCNNCGAVRYPHEVEGGQQ